MICHQLLIDNKILSAPVLNKKTHKWVGFVDIIDLVHHALNVLNVSKADLDGADFDQLFASDKFSNPSCGSIVGTVLNIFFLSFLFLILYLLIFF